VFLLVTDGLGQDRDFITVETVLRPLIMGCPGVGEVLVKMNELDLKIHKYLQIKVSRSDVL
jgi:hypothetical protein